MHLECTPRWSGRQEAVLEGHNGTVHVCVCVFGGGCKGRAGGKKSWNKGDRRRWREGEKGASGALKLQQLPVLLDFPGIPQKTERKKSSSDIIESCVGTMPTCPQPNFIQE